MLILDYTGRRAEAPISAMGLESYGIETRYLLVAPHVRRYDAAEYAAALLDRCAPAVSRVAAVLAYCVAGSIAQELAVRLSTSDASVPMVVFDGEPATVEAVNAEYRLAGRKLWGLVSVDRKGFVEPEVLDEQALWEAPEYVTGVMYRWLRSLGVRAAEQGSANPDVDEDEIDVVANYFLDWLIHLIAAHNAAMPSWAGSVLQVVSRDHGGVESWPGAGTTTIEHIQESRNELLRHPDARAAVLAFLSSEARRVAV